jgi:hypothetical protein
MLQSLISEGAPAVERGKVVVEALRNGWELRPLAKAIGITHWSLLKWLKSVNNGKNDLDRGRPSELLPSHKAVLTRLASNPATAHLPIKVLWQYYLQEFECSPECQASHDCPHETVSYYPPIGSISERTLPSLTGK